MLRKTSQLLRASTGIDFVQCTGVTVVLGSFIIVCCILLDYEYFNSKNPLVGLEISLFISSFNEVPSPSPEIGNHCSEVF